MPIQIRPNDAGPTGSGSTTMLKMVMEKEVGIVVNNTVMVRR
jgi:hypothetical protein